MDLICLPGHSRIFLISLLSWADVNMNNLDSSAVRSTLCMHAERKRMFVVSTLRLPPHQNLLLTTCSLSWTLSNIIIPCLLLCHEARPVNRFHCLHTSVAAGCESAASREWSSLAGRTPNFTSQTPFSRCRRRSCSLCRHRRRGRCRSGGGSRAGGRRSRGRARQTLIEWRGHRRCRTCLKEPVMLTL